MANPDKRWMLAETEFVGDPELRPIEFFRKKHLPDVPLDQIKKRAEAEAWDARRMSFWQGVKAAYLRGKQMTLLRERDTELEEAQELRSQLYQVIKPRNINGILSFPVEPKSYEGVLGAYVKLEQLIESKRAAMLDAIQPALSETEDQLAAQGREATEPEALPFSDDELRQMAHKILDARRADRLKSKDQDDE